MNHLTFKFADVPLHSRRLTLQDVNDVLMTRKQNTRVHIYLTSRVRYHFCARDSKLSLRWPGFNL